MNEGALLSGMVSLVTALLLSVPAAAQSPGKITLDIPSGDATVRGRFFPARGGMPLATLLIVPGWGGDPVDASGMGAALSARGVNVLLINFRGVQQSTGRFSYANALDDLGAALTWLRSPGNSERFQIDPDRFVLGGNSFGGGVAMVYAARDSTVRRVISIVGADHGVTARRIRGDTAYAARLRSALAGSRSPRGSVQFEPEVLIEELLARESDNDLVRLAPRLADRAVLLIGGWRDLTAPIERDLLPVYRALTAEKVSDATILAYPDGHGLRSHRERVADDIVAWLTPRLQR